MANARRLIRDVQFQCTMASELGRAEAIERVKVAAELAPSTRHVMISCKMTRKDRILLKFKAFSSVWFKFVGVSDCWAQQTAIKRIHASLVRRGFTVWIDFERMHGSTVTFCVFTGAECAEPAHRVVGPFTAFP